MSEITLLIRSFVYSITAGHRKEEGKMDGYIDQSISQNITLAKINQEEGQEMCTALSLDLYCTNFKCPHNLFWEKLSLDRDKIHVTDKALEIRNCCCKIIRPWTPEEIGDAWGLTGEAIRCSEEEAFRKLQKKIRIKRKGELLSKSTVHRRGVV